MFIANEAQHEGITDYTPIYPREVVNRVLVLSASAIIAHNHPNKDPTPSPGDIAIIKEVREACKRLVITRHDHIVVGRNGTSSFKSLGLL